MIEAGSVAMRLGGKYRWNNSGCRQNPHVSNCRSMRARAKRPEPNPPEYSATRLPPFGANGKPSSRRSRGTRPHRLVPNLQFNHQGKIPSISTIVSVLPCIPQMRSISYTILYAWSSKHDDTIAHTPLPSHPRPSNDHDFDRLGKRHPRPSPPPRSRPHHP